MASSSISRSGRMTYLSPERTKIWTEPSNSKLKSDRKVPIVYYLSRNGQLEHPHFMEVTLSSDRGLFLSDVLNRLNALRGKGMASLYSWSCKRSYRNGFVWHDLSEEDFIYPAHGNEYVLKGSELPLELSIQESPIAVRRRRNQSCSSIDFNNNLNEYHNVYQAEIPDNRSTDAADASTQTDDLRKLHRLKHTEIVEAKEEDEIEVISPPSTDSSPETLEKLMKVDKRLILGTENPTADNHPNARKSSVLMQLISCGSISFKDCGPNGGLISHYKMRLPRGGGTGRVKLEDKEYFSGSLVETKKPEFPALKRSTSYNADGRSKMELPSREIDGVGAKYMHRKLKTAPSNKKEEITRLSCDSTINRSVCT